MLSGTMNPRGDRITVDVVNHHPISQEPAVMRLFFRSSVFRVCDPRARLPHRPSGGAARRRLVAGHIGR